ncbi:MAG: hypothetical protein HRU70_02840 [Phycisphaeraceae bacterium]|nr:MAG: hypothetical protein HRU70_02840 [Phycisphaeraceae bacterium]
MTPLILRHPTVLAALLALLAALCLAPGCEKSLSDDTYERIAAGMSIDEVNSILGGPGEKQTTGGATTLAGGIVMGLPGVQRPGQSLREVYTWREERREVSVTFDDGKVVDKNKSGF